MSKKAKPEKAPSAKGGKRMSMDELKEKIAGGQYKQVMTAKVLDSANDSQAVGNLMAANLGVSAVAVNWRLLVCLSRTVGWRELLAKLREVGGVWDVLDALSETVDIPAVLGCVGVDLVGGGGGGFSSAEYTLGVDPATKTGSWSAQFVASTDQYQEARKKMLESYSNDDIFNEAQRRGLIELNEDDQEEFSA